MPHTGHMREYRISERKRRNKGASIDAIRCAEPHIDPVCQQMRMTQHAIETPEIPGKGYQTSARLLLSSDPGMAAGNIISSDNVIVPGPAHHTERRDD